MNKSQLLEAIEQEQISDELKNEVKAELQGYPEELSDDDLLKFDGYLAEIQEMELMLANAHDEIASTIAQQNEQEADNFVGFTNEVVSKVNTELQTANQLVDGAAN